MDLISEGQQCPVVGLGFLCVRHVCGQSSWLRSGGRVCFCSRVGAALSAYPHCMRPLSLGSLLVLLSPGLALHCRSKLARGGLCVDLFSAPQPCPLCCGDVWISLNTLSSSSVLRGLCAPLSALWGFCVLFWVLQACHLVGVMVCELLIG